MTGVPGRIRPAAEDDLPVVQGIERAAGRLFADVGMGSVADDDPPSLAELQAYRRGGRAWVRTAADDRPVAYLLADVVDGCAHLEQVTVDPTCAGAGLGRELIEHLRSWAEERGLPAITLTTFTEVPWNGPYYLRLGFRYLDPADLGPGLRAVRAAEADHGLDRWPRAAMRMDLRPPARSG